MAQRPVFTIITPTFNRAALLPRVHDSLKAQTFRDFEWLVVDDGSEDATRDLVQGWAANSEFAIRYVWQPNSGKHVALNRAANLGRGRYFTVIDSDDWYLPTALETFLQAWESIPPQEFDSFSGVAGLCVDPSGKLVGTRFPRCPFDSSQIDLAPEYAIQGDKAGCGRADVTRAFPFPVIDGERLIIEAIVYRRIARSYRIRCVNEAIKVVEYQPYGLSATTGPSWVENPKTAKLYFRELLDDGAGGVTTYANHLRFALHAGLGRLTFAESPSKWWWAATAPLAVGLYVRDTVRRWR